MTSLPRFIENLLSNIDFCCMTGERQKICFKRKTTVDSNSWYGSFYRWWWDEDHDKLADKLREMIRDSAEILDNFEYTKYRPLILYRLVKLDEFVIRQENVYAENIDAKSKLAPIRDLIKEQLEKMTSEDREEIEKLKRESRVPLFSTSPGASFGDSSVAKSPVTPAESPKEDLKKVETCPETSDVKSEPIPIPSKKKHK